MSSWTAEPSREAEGLPPHQVHHSAPMRIPGVSSQEGQTAGNWASGPFFQDGRDVIALPVRGRGGVRNCTAKGSGASVQSRGINTTSTLNLADRGAEEPRSEQRESSALVGESGGLSFCPLWEDLLLSVAQGFCTISPKVGNGISQGGGGPRVSREEVGACVSCVDGYIRCAMCT